MRVLIPLGCVLALGCGAPTSGGRVERKPPAIPVSAEQGTLDISGVQWRILLGHLNPLDDVPDEGISGIQARLRNLRYYAGAIDGEFGPRAKSAHFVGKGRHRLVIPRSHSHL